MREALLFLRCCNFCFYVLDVHSAFIKICSEVNCTWCFCFVVVEGKLFLASHPASKHQILVKRRIF